MLKNFQLVAIVKRRSKNCLLQIPLHQTTQDRLAEVWQTQFEAFVNEIEEVDFALGYQPEDHEHFCLYDYMLPEWLSGKSSQTISMLEEINKCEIDMSSIKGIVAFAQNDQGEELMLFQNFTRTRVIKPGRFLFLKENTYESVEHHGLTLDRKLSAIYFPEKSKLLFSSFRTVNTFLPLGDYYREASDKDIRDLLSHNLLIPEDIDTSVSDANQWSRKRYAMLKDSNVLDEYPVEELQSHAKAHGVHIRTSNDKIVFPTDRVATKKLLQFLNEELFRGAITETLYETNSKREAS